MNEKELMKIEGNADDISISLDMSGFLTKPVGDTLYAPIEALKEKVNKAEPARVATTGNYNDLEDKPNIPAAVTVDKTLSPISNNAIANNTVTTALNGKVNVADFEPAAEDAKARGFTRFCPFFLK